MKISIFDQGKNWMVPPAGSLQLFIDGRYIAAIQVTDSDVIIVSTEHKIELREVD